MKLVKNGSKYLLLFLSFLFADCSSKGLSEDIAVKVYVEKVVVEEKYFNLPDSIYYYKNKVFRKYNTSEEDLKTFLNSLEFKSENWNRFFKKADEYLIQLKSNRVIE